MEEIKVNTVEEAIKDFHDGKFVIVVDDRITGLKQEKTENIICKA